MTHGGDIYRNRVSMDYSININLGIPTGVKRALYGAVRHCMEYPDIEARELRMRIGKKYGIPKENILCGNGASELFLAIAHGIKPERTGIPVPSFGGYEYAAKASGSDIRYLFMGEADGFCLSRKLFEPSEGRMDMLILANPNNPVGNIIESKMLIELVTRCMEEQTVVVVDECFIEFTGKEESFSLINEIKRFPNLIIVRAFTKSYAVPGVRLGYLLSGNQELIAQIGKQLPEWNLSSFAQAAGIAALKEKGYLEKTVRDTQREREYLTRGLRQEKITVYPSETNFLLLHTELSLYEELLKRKVMIRDCRDFKGLEKGYYRIAVKKHKENRKLLRMIHQIKAGQQGG